MECLHNIKWSNLLFAQSFYLCIFCESRSLTALSNSAVSLQGWLFNFPCILYANIVIPRKCNALDHPSYASLQPKLLQICNVDERYVCFARNEDRWLIYDSETVEVSNTWLLSLEQCPLFFLIVWFWTCLHSWCVHPPCRQKIPGSTC
jgi:hypothetical protein